MDETITFKLVGASVLILALILLKGCTTVPTKNVSPLDLIYNLEKFQKSNHDLIDRQALTISLIRYMKKTNQFSKANQAKLNMGDGELIYLAQQLVQKFGKGEGE